MEIKKANTLFNGQTGSLTGSHVQTTVRKLKDIGDIFEDQAALEKMDLEQSAYKVEMHAQVDAIEGGLQFGTSYLYPGKVGDEYFMTKGHFHAILNRAEYYWGIKGEGVLLLMDEERKCWAEKVTPGTLHYIPGYVAHRLINVGNDILTVGACWSSDAGYDYETIQKEGFAARVKEVNGTVTLQLNS